MLRLRYKGKERIVEPHDYGEQKGVVKLLTFQIGGSSSGNIPGWRLLDVAQIIQAEMVERSFNGGRQTPSGKHQKWDRLYIRVKPAD